MGLHRAGFEVVGVDNRPQKRYPFEFVCADAMNFPLAGFDFVWASPPCQRYSRLQQFGFRDHPDLLPAVRDRLAALRVPWVIENVYGAPLCWPVMLCGLSFDLSVYRHRFFESSIRLFAPAHVKHDKAAMRAGKIFGVHGHSGGTREKRSGAYYSGTHADWSRAMGIDWMINAELVEAIPPAYSEFLARQVIEVLRRVLIGRVNGKK